MAYSVRKCLEKNIFFSLQNDVAYNLIWFRNTMYIATMIMNTMYIATMLIMHVLKTILKFLEQK